MMTGDQVKPEPKVIWVNEYAGGCGFGYGSEQMAKDCGARALRVAVRYVESPAE